jgi:hypothetical protein
MSSLDDRPVRREAGEPTVNISNIGQNTALSSFTISSLRQSHERPIASSVVLNWVDTTTLQKRYPETLLTRTCSWKERLHRERGRLCSGGGHIS